MAAKKRALRHPSPVPDLVEHAVSQVEIDHDEVRAVCACGWKSATSNSETLAREDFDLHAQPA